MNSGGRAVHYLSTTEVAALLGISRAALSKYRLPEPDATIGNVRGWRESTIRKWNDARPGRGNWRKGTETERHAAGHD